MFNRISFFVLPSGKSYRSETRLTGDQILNLWHDIIDSLTDAIIVLSPAMEPQVVNPAAETMLGVSQVSAATVADLVRQNDWLGRMVGACLESGQDLGDTETVLATGPRELTVRVEVSPLLNAEGRPGGVIILLHDLSHEKGAAEAAVTGDLSLRLSPAGLAHEVKNPLTGIKGAAELMAGMFPDDGRAQQYCSVILDGVNRIASLVEQVLMVSGPQRLVQEPVNIHMVLHQAMRMAGLFPQPPEGVVVLQDFDPSLPDVVGDAGALERTFLNLIKNAAEAIGESGTIRLHTRIEREFRMTRRGAASPIPASRDQRQRRRHRGGSALATVHAVLHHQAGRHRSRPRAMPTNHRPSRRQAMGTARRRRSSQRRCGVQRDDVQGNPPNDAS